MVELNTATIVWFNVENKYGFAEDEWGQQIFFHLNDGRNCRIEKDQLVFYKPRNFITYKVDVLSEPAVGNIIQFVRAKGSMGRPKAKPWTYDHMVTSAYIDDFHENEECLGCGHKMFEHSGEECQHVGCHCGDPAYEYDQLDDTGGCSQEEPGGITDCW